MVPETRNLKKGKPKLAVCKLASCDGCQLSLLDCEDELLQIAELVQIASFPEATRHFEKGPYDLTLVEGSVCREHELEMIKEIRAQSRFLVTIGACATAGGIQSLRNFADAKEYVSFVYAKPQYISALATSTPVSAHVAPDYELWGCPVNKEQLVEVVNAFLNGRKPNITARSVCMECKAKNTVCIQVSRGTPCMGPVTHSGCGAICPAYARGCYGCFGPKETPNTASLADWWKRELGAQEDFTQRSFRTYNAWAPEFRAESEKHGKK
ncbi:MAG: hypothetical protein PHP45_07350 [Elusimicrobiales bacterium]|nr:hypothetical protein [Elusimicrobiales bacterium]